MTVFAAVLVVILYIVAFAVFFCPFIRAFEDTFAVFAFLVLTAHFTAFAAVAHVSFGVYALIVAFSQALV